MSPNIFAQPVCVMMKHIREINGMSQLVVDKLGESTLRTLNSYAALYIPATSPVQSPRESPVKSLPHAQHSPDFGGRSSEVATHSSQLVAAQRSQLTAHNSDDVAAQESQLTAHNPDVEAHKSQRKTSASSHNSGQTSIAASCCRLLASSNSDDLDLEQLAAELSSDSDEQLAAELDRDIDECGEDLDLEQLAAQFRESSDESQGDIRVNMVPALRTPPPSSPTANFC